MGFGSARWEKAKSASVPQAENKGKADKTRQEGG
jgi:hypothetical protein